MTDDNLLEVKLKEAGFTRGASYEFFMLAVSLLSFVNLLLLWLPFKGEVNNVIYIVDFITAMLFLVDFIVRFSTSTNRRKYFFRQFGWADLLASIPITSLNIFRIFRVVRFFRIYRVMGGKKMAKRIANKPADIALYLVFFFILLLIEFGSIGVLVAEKGAPDANILTASEAIWWTFVSITTVGYGDYYPVTNPGRIVGVITLTVGVGLFGVVTGYLANAFLGKKSD